MTSKTARTDKTAPASAPVLVTTVTPAPVATPRPAAVLAPTTAARKGDRVRVSAVPHPVAQVWVRVHNLCVTARERGGVASRAAILSDLFAWTVPAPAGYRDSDGVAVPQGMPVRAVACATIQTQVQAYLRVSDKGRTTPAPSDLPRHVSLDR